MQKALINSWQKLQSRERAMVSWGALAAILMLLYTFVWSPWHKAIFHMESVITIKRVDLVWMRQQAAALGDSGTVAPQANVKGTSQSLMAVVERSAKASGVGESIQQMIPRQNNTEVSVVLESVSFSKWLRWVDILEKQYAVTVKQLSAERDTTQPDTAEIRVTFSR